ncbi:MAG: RNA methyltransferase [Pseudomonadota bacterium]
MTKQRSRRPASALRDADGRVWTYGRHAVAAALANPARTFSEALFSKNAEADFEAALTSAAGAVRPDSASPAEISARLPAGAVHQGAALFGPPPPSLSLDVLCAAPALNKPIVVLDQVTDPQNIGAIFRSAAAFGAAGLVLHDRRTPPLGGALAKAAAGAVDLLPHSRVPNIAQALALLGDAGYVRIGLTGDGETLSVERAEAPIALVLGAEGAGLRRLTRDRCDRLARIPIAPEMESLNVSAAAAVALFAITR